MQSGTRADGDGEKDTSSVTVVVMLPASLLVCKVYAVLPLTYTPIVPFSSLLPIPLSIVTTAASQTFGLRVKVQVSVFASQVPL